MKATIVLLIVIVSTASAQPSTRCDRGSFFDGVKCLLCPPGTYSETNRATSCTNCTAGTFNPFEGAQVFTACQSCPSDTFGELEGATSADVCQRCPQGTHSNGGSGPCRSCPPGEIVVSFSGCRRCRDGEISVENVCVPCPPGTTAERRSPFPNECRPCPPDQFLFAGTCSLCPRGNVYNPAEGTCLPCPRGFFNRNDNSTSCEPCRRRFFTRNPASSRCIRCPQGFETRGRGASICRRIGAACPSNSIENRNGDCVTCSFGFKLNLSTESCELCPEGSFSIGGITTECRRCPDISIPSKDGCRCPERTEWRNGRCRGCRRGTSGRFGICGPCENGFHAPRRGMSSCSRCPQGMISESERGSVRCIRCPNGTVPGGNPPRCVVPITGCPPGFTRSGRRCNVFECPEGSFLLRRRECRSCQPGSRSARGAGCRPCPQRFVSPGGAVPTCERCPNGFVQDVFNRTSCVCEGFSARGFELVNGRCQECGQGMFNDGLGSGPAKCIPCPEGSIPFPGRYRCGVCRGDNTVIRNGTCVFCPRGTFSYSFGDAVCQPLPE